MGDIVLHRGIRISKKDAKALARIKKSKVAADIVFVIDTTGSMSDKIQGLLNTCERFADEISRRVIDYRIAIVAFGDLTVLGDTIEGTPFTQSVEVVKNSLRNIPRNSGGGNEGESSLEALCKSLKYEYRKGAVKVFILITDEPPLTLNYRVEDVIQRLRRAKVMAFCIAPNLLSFKRIAKDTGGDFFLVERQADFLSIIDRLGKRVSQKVAKRYLELHAGDKPNPKSIRRR